MKMDRKKLIRVGVLPAVLIVGLATTAGACDDSSEAKPNDRAAVQASDSPRPKENAKAEEPTQTPLQEFTACVAKSGTSAEKAAVKHVVKLTGMDDWNGILDNPKAWTDYNGGITKAAEANLITSAFAGCYESDNGLITVYTADGHVAGNGQF